MEQTTAIGVCYVYCYSGILSHPHIVTLVLNAHPWLLHVPVIVFDAIMSVSSRPQAICSCPAFILVRSVYSILVSSHHWTSALR